MRHAYLQPAGEDGLVARHRADRTCHPLPLSRPSIPRRLTKEIMMKKLALIATAAALFASAPAYAAIRTTTLAVKNMTCVTCGPIVKKSLSRVPGVTEVEVSTEEHTETTNYEDAKTSTKKTERGRE